MISSVFAFCVMLLEEVARDTGLSYEAINVIFFCVIWPLFTLGLMYVVADQHKTIKRLRKNLSHAHRLIGEMKTKR